MNRSNGLIVLRTLVVTLLLTFSPALARQTAQGPQGEFAGDGMKLTLNPAGGAAYTGAIEIDGQQFELRGEMGQGAIRGSFVVEGDKFPFTISPSGEKLIFETEGTKYALSRVEKKPKNPLQRGGGVENPAPQNPLDRGGAGGNAALGGVGVQLGKDADGKWTIGALKPGGPAEQSGMKVGEILVAIDDKPVDGMTEEQIGTLLRGPVGSSVHVSTVMHFGGGAKAESTREIERADMSVPPANVSNQPNVPNQPNQPPMGPGDANLKPYQHRSGIWSVNAPTGEWQLEESPDGNTSTWKHPSGAMIFVTLVPQVPAKDAEGFYQMVSQGVQQGGAQMSPPNRWDGYGAPVLIGQFSRQRNGTNEMGQLTVGVVNGTGVIAQMTLPEAKSQEFFQMYDTIARSFKLGSR